MNRRTLLIEAAERLINQAKRDVCHSPTEDALIDAVDLLLEVVKIDALEWTAT